jgi:outer membrane lipoprotein SlyB
MKPRVVSVLLSVVPTLIWVGGCQNHAQSHMAGGAVVGAGIGQIAGGNTEATAIGAVIGGAAGYIIGNEADKHEARKERAEIREEADYVTVNVTNSNGSISQVRLKKYGVGYVGTRGEYYPKLPTEDQLRPVYGF